MYRTVAFFSIIYVTMCEVTKSVSVKTEINTMVGVDAVHTVKINKDTIITRNLKLANRGTRDSTGKTDENTTPDWSYSPIPNEVSKHVEEFKKNMSECLKDVQASDKRPIKRLSPKTESPVHGECLIACVLKRNGVIENGKINKRNLILLVSKFYGKETKLLKKLDKSVDRCIERSVRNRDECVLASQLNDCTNDLMSINKHKITLNY